MLKCSKCKQLKEASEFSPRRGRARGFKSWCKTCENAYNMLPDVKEKRLAWNRANGSLHYKWRDIRRKYDISADRWMSMLIGQEGLCGCCFGPPTKIKGGLEKWCTDHDHKTGKVRGLLCNECNTMLGMAHDDTIRLQRGIDYLGGPKLAPLIEQTSILGNVEYLL